ncbi:hypothetical protein M3Y96_01164400 [Aphelenchoides besseyi]|nr:hypothetical protein M3Y96_01164400 [Aphelenchoides besseyi]
MSILFLFLLYSTISGISSIPTDSSLSNCEHDPNARLVVTSECPSLGPVYLSKNLFTIILTSNVTTSHVIKIKIRGCTYFLNVSSNGIQKGYFDDTTYKPPLTFQSTDNAITLRGHDDENPSACYVNQDGEEAIYNVVDVQFNKTFTGVQFDFSGDVKWSQQLMLLSIETTKSTVDDEPLTELPNWVYIVVGLVTISCCGLLSMIICLVYSFCREILGD